MKTSTLKFAAILCFCGAGILSSLGLEKRGEAAAPAAAESNEEHPATATTSNDKRITIEDIELDSNKRPRREVAWLGVSTEEASEALASQLGLNPGEGLVVTYVAPDSPAAKADLQKNDVLVKLGGQSLVLPAQLRKLVQSRKDGDTIELTIYRAGKKQLVSAKLARTSRGGDPLLDEESWPGDLRDLKDQLKDLKIGEKVREEMRAAREAMARAGVDKESIRAEIQRSMREARKAVREALRQATNAMSNAEPLAKELAELVRREMDFEKDSTVTVKNDGKSIKTIVTRDDTGTYVIVADPKKRLTAHDKDGKLIFDGAIETADEQDKVPKDIWEKVKRMIDQPEPKAEEPEKEKN
jgi:PDZ domain